MIELTLVLIALGAGVVAVHFRAEAARHRAEAIGAVCQLVDERESSRAALEELRVEHVRAVTLIASESQARTFQLAESHASNLLELARPPAPESFGPPGPPPEPMPASIRGFVDSLGEPARSRTLEWVSRERSRGLDWPEIQATLADGLDADVGAVPV